MSNEIGGGPPNNGFSIQFEGNINDENYAQFLSKFSENFSKIEKDNVLFTTDVKGLWEIYLDSFPGECRQHHNCRACREFITKFGGLVRISASSGKIFSALWAMENGEIPPVYREGFNRLWKAVSHARVTGVFIPDFPILGRPLTGAWRHFACQASIKVEDKLRTPHQLTAQKHEDFLTIIRAMEEYSQPLCQRAVEILQSDELYHSEKFLGQAVWLRDLYGFRTNAMNKTNITWLAVATAPEGFCHPRSSMIGTLLDDLKDGFSPNEAARRFNAKMHPLLYQRPQSPPKSGTIAQAEELFKKLGAERSLKRRFARFEETPRFWSPRHTDHKPKGIFSHLSPKEELSSLHQSQPMTWEKFQKTLLLEARELYLRIRNNDNFTAITTAVDFSAPPILQWDSENLRNPYSWYVWYNGSRPEQWGLRTGAWTKILGITNLPCHWSEIGVNFNHAPGAILLLEGMKETNLSAGAAIFPENLKSDFHSVRSVIEAYSKSSSLEDPEHGTACGLLLSKAFPNPVQLKLVLESTEMIVTLDRWD